MLDYGKSWARRLALNTLAALAAAALLSSGAMAQTSDKSPRYIQSQQWVDLGNGPTEILPIEGNGLLYSSGSGGVGTSAGTTALTLAAAPALAANFPLVGAVITCAASNTVSPCTIPGGTTITAFNGTTGITTSVATTTTAANLVWGAACPAATGVNVPGVNPDTLSGLLGPLSSSWPLRFNPSGNAGAPMYTTARLCVYGGMQNGLTFAQFPIGAH